MALTNGYVRGHRGSCVHATRRKERKPGGLRSGKPGICCTLGKVPFWAFISTLGHRTGSRCALLGTFRNVSWNNIFVSLKTS